MAGFTAKPAAYAALDISFQTGTGLGVHHFLVYLLNFFRRQFFGAFFNAFIVNLNIFNCCILHDGYPP